MLVDCQACGRRLELPADFPETAAFACAHCELIMLNVEGVRSFRWSDVDPYVRAHGASRLNLWGGLIGSCSWIPILMVVLAATGRFDAGLVAALALPYVPLLWAAARLRARAPAARWVSWLWMGMGAYCAYLWLLLASVPLWGRILSQGPGSMGPAGSLGIFGAVALAVGALGEAAYRRRLARTPRFVGAPPAGPADPRPVVPGSGPAA